MKKLYAAGLAIGLLTLAGMHTRAFAFESTGQPATSGDINVDDRGVMQVDQQAHDATTDVVENGSVSNNELGQIGTSDNVGVDEQGDVENGEPNGPNGERGEQNGLDEGQQQNGSDGQSSTDGSSENQSVQQQQDAGQDGSEGDGG